MSICLKTNAMTDEEIHEYLSYGKVTLSTERGEYLRKKYWKNPDATFNR